MPGGLDEARASALCKAAQLAVAHGDSVRALRYAEQALELAGWSGNALKYANAAFVRGHCAGRAGQSGVARHWLMLARTAFHTAGARSRSAGADCLLASIDASEAPIDSGKGNDQLEEAALRFDAALAIFRETNHKPGIARSLGGTAYVAYKQGDWELALTILHDLLRSSWDQGRILISSIEDVADIASRSGQSLLAARLYGAVDADRRSFGQIVPPAYQREIEEERAFIRSSLGEKAFLSAFEAGAELSIERAMMDALAFAERALVPPPVHLTSREQEILALLGEDLTAQELADQLFLDRRTVETHLANLYAKLGAHSRSEAVEAAVDRGLLSSD
ncbi:MAG: hypothetical protein KC438_14000 [Thermomicrobiales bacterium]|nr:hypothetical protein [Thermomicrobiales bacterium]